MSAEIDNVTVAMESIQKWVGNPISLALLRFVAKRDKCGRRLSIAIDHYLGKEVKACWKCKLAAKIVSFVLSKGGKTLGVKEADIKAGLELEFMKRGIMNVLEGIAKYGVTKPQIVNAPFLVVWDITNLCNLKCKHCYKRADKQLPDELTTEEAKKLIDEFAEEGVAVIAFSGGEPLLRPDFFEILDYANKKGMFCAVASNGTVITPEIAKKLKGKVEYIEISVDGLRSTHDKFRGIPGVFNRTVKGIKNCVDVGLYTCLATTVTHHNYKEFNKIYDLTSKLKVNRIMHFNFIPTGRGTDITELDLTPEERENLLNFMIDKNAEGPTEILSTAPQLARVAVARSQCTPAGHFFNTAVAERELAGMNIGAIANFVGGCGAGRLYCSVEPNGDVQPCVFIEIKVGNVREKSFSEIWHTSEVLNKLRDRDAVKGHCAECEYKYQCGGCRARAWAYFRDLQGPDPGCINNKEYYEEACRNSKKPISSKTRKKLCARLA